MKKDFKLGNPLQGHLNKYLGRNTIWTPLMGPLINSLWVSATIFTFDFNIHIVERFFESELM